MNFRIGTDIEKNSRFKLFKDSSFLKDIFSKKEIEYAFKNDSPEITLCGLFCAKEATKKTLTENGIGMNDIEIIHNVHGKPILKFKNNSIDNSHFDVSISHSKTYSTASVIRRRKDERQHE